MSARPNRFSIATIITLICLCHHPAIAGIDDGAEARAGRLLANQPLYFEANRDQISEKFDYLTRAGNLRAYIGSAGAVMSLRGAAQPGLSEDGKESRWNVELTIASADPKAGHRGEKKLPGKVNYFKGSKAQWKTDIPTYGRVRYKQVLPGIDVAYYGDGRSLEYDFVVSPGADPGAIALKFRGQSGLSLDDNGALVLTTGLGNLVNKKPVVYQEKDGRRRPVEGSYKLLAADTVGFTIGQYDKTAALIIDPEIVYCGYIGGSGHEYGNGIAVDSSGAVYVAGYTNSTEADFPETVGPGLTFTGGLDDAFVAKISADGKSLIYCGYIGGDNDDQVHGIAVDTTGAAYVAGYTNSTGAPNFPVIGGPDLNLKGGRDAFVAKISADGKSLIYCGYIGGGWNDYGYGIAVDSSGAAYVTGYTASTQDNNFPVTVGPDLNYNGGENDAFVAKVSADGSSLAYCGYIGVLENDYGYGIAVDSSGAAYVNGYTQSSKVQNFPVAVGPGLTYSGGTDAFVAKVSADGSSLAYCGYIGGSDTEYGYRIAVDSSGAAYVTGETRSDEGSFPVAVGPGLTHNGDADAYVAKVSADGSSLDYCGYIGGSQGDYGNGIAVDSSGAAYVTGNTQSDQTTFPIAVGPGLTFSGGSDVFVAKVATDGSSLDYCGYIGGSQGDYAKPIAVDSSGAAYVVGNTMSTEADFPVAVGPDLTHNGGNDVFVAKISAVENSGGGDGGDRSRQAGGPTDKLGGGGNNPPPLALDGSVTNITPGQGGNLSQTRMLPLASPGGGANGSAAIINSDDGPPGLMVQLTAPGGDSTQAWMPLEGTGRTPRGIGWATVLRFNYDVQVVDLTLDWPSETLSQMTKGRWTISYWFQTAAGARSNQRWEYLDVTGASATNRPSAAAQSELTFNLMLSVFDAGSHRASRVGDGLVECIDNDQTYSSAQVSDGLVSINIPLGRTSYLVFSSDEFVGQRTLRCRFSDGILNIRDEDNAKDPVAYYQNPDGEGYCLEYYRDKLFICNPGPSNGPIMGRLYGK